MRLNKAAFTFQVPITKLGKTGPKESRQDGRGHISGAGTRVQILVLPLNGPVTSRGLSRPQIPLTENTASWLLQPPPVPCTAPGTWLTLRDKEGVL